LPASGDLLPASISAVNTVMLANSPGSGPARVTRVSKAAHQKQPYAGANQVGLSLQTAVNLFDTHYTPALTTPVVPIGPATGNEFASAGNHANCSNYGRGRTFLRTAKAQV